MKTHISPANISPFDISPSDIPRRRSSSSGLWVLVVMVIAALLGSVPVADAAGAPTTAPTGVRASAGPQTAGVSWTGVTGDVTYYTVTSSPGGKQCTVPATSTVCYVPDLTAGQTYTFTVVAGNDAGIGPASTASAPVTIDPIPPDPGISIKRLATKVTSNNVRFRTKMSVFPAGEIRQKIISQPDMNPAKQWLECKKKETVEDAGTYTFSCPMGGQTRAALQKGAVKVEVTSYLKPVDDERIPDRKTWTINRKR